MSNQTLAQNEDKPYRDSWHSKIQNKKAFVIFTEELLKFIPESERDKSKHGVVDICLSMWKFAAIDGCGTAKQKKDVQDTLISEANDNSINSARKDSPGEAIENADKSFSNRKDKLKKTRKKSCDC
jgi:hypothetical protein